MPPAPPDAVSFFLSFSSFSSLSFLSTSSRAADCDCAARCERKRSGEDVEDKRGGGLRCLLLVLVLLLFVEYGENAVEDPLAPGMAMAEMAGLDSE